MKKIEKLLLIFLCMIAVFCFSQDSYQKSNQKSDTIIIKFSQVFLHQKLNEQELDELVHRFDTPVRKCAHFFIFMVLGILLFQFFQLFSFSVFKKFFLSIFLSFLYACSDEIHQLFVPGRSGRIFDVFIDTLGAVVGSFLVYCLYCKKQGRKLWKVDKNES